MKIRAFPFLIFLLCLTSCSVIKEFIGQSVKEPQVLFESAKISKLSFSDIDLLFDIKVRNPNKIGIKLSGLQYDLLLNGNSFLKGDQPKGIEIPSLGEEIVQIPVNIRFLDLYKTFQSLQERGLSSYQIKVGLLFDIPVLGAVQIPVSKTGEIPLVKIPKISFEGLSVKNLYLTKADIVLRLKLSNPNAFSIMAKSGNYQLKLSGQEIFSGMVSGQSIQVRENSQGIVDIPLAINLLNVSWSVYQILMGSDSIDYDLSGSFDLETSLPILGKVELPFNLSGRTPLDR